jgi:hypothetical protein
VLCLQILRNQLPLTVPLPSSAETFFVCVLKEATRTPSASNLTAAYDVLSGACQHLPQLLPSKEWTKLEDELVKIVKSSRTIQNQSLSILCLGILQALRGQQPDYQGRSNIVASSFFIGSKALKSLSLAILQAAWVTKTTHHISRVDVLRSLSITSSILKAMSRETLETWSRSPEGQGAISRLLSQCADSNLHVEVQLKVRTGPILVNESLTEIL